MQLVWIPQGPIDKWIGPYPSSEIEFMVKTQLMSLDFALPHPEQEPLASLERLELRLLKDSRPHQPFILARLAFCYQICNYHYGAFKYSQSVLSILGRTADATFTAWADHAAQQWNLQYQLELRVYINPYSEHPDIDILHVGDIRPLDGYVTGEPVELAALVKHEWSRINAEWPPGKATEMFSRLLCVESNELENVFELGGSSMRRLVRCGFFAAAIERLASDSAIQNRQQILQNLNDTHSALANIIGWAQTNSIHIGFRFVRNGVACKNCQCLPTIDIVHNHGKKYHFLPVYDWRRVTVFARKG